MTTQRPVVRDRIDTPREQRYYEDYHSGHVYEFGAERVTEADIVEFARRFDPQPFHVDPVAARESTFGGLIASGWHTGSLMIKLLNEHYLSPVASLPSPGIDELRWPAPVRPGDVLRLRITIGEKRRSRTRPDRGIVKALVEVLNQRDEVVLTHMSISLFLCRHPHPVERQPHAD